jgi:hypothetical protein
MKLIRAARFAGLVMAGALFFLYFLLGQGLQVGGDWVEREGWLQTHPALWMAGGWLTLLAIFGWMVLMVVFLYMYSPGHRVATMLQSGLILISAVLLISGTIVWMNLLPPAVDGTWARFVDRLAMTFSGAGFFMGGAVTSWIALDMALMQKLPRTWMAGGVAAGLLILPAPFLLPITTPLILGIALLAGWSLFLGLRRSMPPAYPEFSL